MKKMIAFMLACCLAFGATACSNTNTNKPEPAKQEETQDNTDSTNETSKESNTNSANNTLLGDEYYNYGIKALESVDQYLDAEIEKGEMLSTLVGLKERVGENDDYGIETLWSILSLLESSLEKDSPDFNIDDVKKYRDDLAGFLKSSLRYRDTTKKTFDITSKDCFEKINMALESIDNSLIVNDFKKVELEEANYFPVSFYATTHNNVSIQYQVDNKTDKLISFLIKLKIDPDNVNFDDLSAFGLYLGMISASLEPDIDGDKLGQGLDFDNISDNNIKSYETDKVLYIKIFKDNEISLGIYVK